MQETLKHANSICLLLNYLTLFPCVYILWLFKPLNYFIIIYPMFIQFYLFYFIPFWTSGLLFMVMSLLSKEN